MYFTTTSFFLTLLILRFSSAKPPLHTWKIKHGSNVGITLGTVITYNILQHYSISITTLIVYFTQYSILLFLRYTLLSIFFFHFYIDLLISCSFIAHFPLSTFCSYTFLIPFHYRSVIIVPVTFSVYINKNLTLITLGCEGRLPMARFDPSPVPLSSCCSPSAEIDKNG
jgi:hypothetical protein